MSDIVTRGTGRFGSPQPISIVPSTLKSSAGVVTWLPARNTQVHEGDVLLTASGRPVFVLQGEVPTYHDFVPGISGNDVRQLEGGLKRLGFDPGPVDETYDERTSAAVSDWYAWAGWQPIGATPEQTANIRALERDLAAAINDKLTADDAAAAAPLAVDAARAKADLSVATERANASADPAVVKAAVQSAQLAGQVEIQTAINAQKTAQREAKRLDDLAARLAADLDATRRQAGVKVPADEIVFVPALPVRVEEIRAALGETASGTVLTVTNNQIAVDASLRLDEAPLVKPGMAVAIDEPDLGIKATGVVGKVADTPGTSGVDGYHIYLEILVDEAPTSLAGISLRLTIPIKATNGAVTAVPVSALSLAADGTSKVQVDKNGTLESIVVKPGLSADGFVEVTPVDGTLTPGQLVVVGYK